MGGNAATFAYLQSRVAVRSQMLLTTERANALIDCAREDERAILAQAGLHALSDEDADDPLRLEQILVHTLVDDIQTLVHAVSATPRDLLIYWVRRFEVGNLKAIIRGKMTGETPDAIRRQLVDIGLFATLPVEDLLRADDVAELLRHVELTPYAEIARQARRVYEEQQALFSLDAAVDRRYFAGLSKRVKAVGEGGGEPLRAIMGALIDRLNLSWLLRYRFAYNLSPAEAYYLLIPAGFRLSSGELLSLAQLGSVAEVIEQVPGALGRVVAGCTSVSGVDDALDAETWRMARSTLHTAAFNLASAFAFLILRERDLNQIAAILKGKRMHVSPALIRQATQLPLTSESGASVGTALGAVG